MSRTSLLSIAAALTLIAAAGCREQYEAAGVRAAYAQPGSDVDVSYFYDQLAPYGRWFDDAPYGWCWTPYDAGADWRPYSDGYWVYTDFGWTWVSNEPWGWATYHYGRWAFDPDYGWVWVPGTEWGPAWVAWRYSDQWIGWAPLPPESRRNVTVGLRFAGSERIEPSDWCFVERRALLDRDLRDRLAPLASNVVLMGHTREATRYAARAGRPVDEGLDVSVVERVTGRTVPRLRVVDLRSPASGRAGTSQPGAIGFFRPRVRPSPTSLRPSQPRQPTMRPPLRPDGQRAAVERQRLESTLARERARLEAQQRRELGSPPRGLSPDALRQRHDIERRAFQDHADRQRRVLETRIRNQIVRPQPPAGGGRPRPQAPGGARGQGPGRSQGRGQDRGRAQDRGGGHRGRD